MSWMKEHVSETWEKTKPLLGGKGNKLCVAFVFSTYMSLTCFFEVKKMMLLMLRYISKFYFSRDLYTRPGVTDLFAWFRLSSVFHIWLSNHAA